MKSPSINDAEPGASRKSPSFRFTLYRQLEPSAWPSTGLSPVNRHVALLVILASILAILETEQTITDPFGPYLFIAECVIVTLFTIEFIARLYAAGEETRYAGLRGRLRYLTSRWAVVDLLAILPFLLTFGAYNSFLLRVLRLLRLLRLARLGRFSVAWNALGDALYARRFELAISAVAAGLLLLFSSACLYVIEAPHQPDTFGSIPRALWWSIATLTTVGYGDVTPITPLGKLFAGITALAGIGLIAMPTGILAAAFSDVFQKMHTHPTKE